MATINSQSILFLQRGSRIKKPLQGNNFLKGSVSGSLRIKVFIQTS
jgi:hypothetical protein